MGREGPREIAAGPPGRLGGYARALLIVLGIGALIRLALLRLPRIWYDEATTGLLGLAVLQGELPIYFFGQPFMGALDGYLAAPVYWLFGVSARTLELVPVLLSIVGIGLTVRLAHDAFGRRPALFTAVLLAVPPEFLLHWSHEARGHYPLTTLLGTLALLLAVRAPAARRGRATLLVALLGGIFGLAFWTNFLSLVYVPAVAVLLLRQGLRPLVPGLLVALPAFVLGSLPHWLYGVPHGTAVPPRGDLIGIERLLAHLGFFGKVAWPVVAGIPATLRGSLAETALALALGGLYLAAVLAALRAARRAPAPAGAVGVALTVLVGTNLGVALLTQYGRELNDYDARYLLPLCAALPILLGRFLAGLPRQPALALTAGLLVMHAAGALAGSFRNLRPAVAATARAELAAQLVTLERVESAGLSRLYDPNPNGRALTFLSAGRVIFSNPYEEPRPRFARAVDGAVGSVWWMPGNSPMLAANFAALGLRFTFQPVGPLGGAFRDFTLTAPPVQEVAPASLRVSASAGAAAVGRMTDRIGSTLWSTGRPQEVGEWIQVDLGARVPVALIRWLPGTHQEVPRGLRLEASDDGTTWRTLVELPRYLGPLYWSAGRPLQRVRSGRVELRVPPSPVRYLRVTQTGSDRFWAWTIRELYVYAAVGDQPAPPVEAAGPALAEAIGAAGVRRLYADHGWASRVALADSTIRVLPANLQLDDYGFRDSVETLVPFFRWEPGTGVLLEPTDAAGFAATARAAGLAFTERPLGGGLILFVHAPPPAAGTPIPAGALRVTASRDPRHARLAVDGDPATRWATAAPREAGDWFRVDLPEARTIRGVRVTVTNPSDLPRDLVVEGSPDGTRWERLPATSRLEHRHRWGGFTLLDDGAIGMRLDFPPVIATALRLVLPSGDAVFDWSIHEITLYDGQ